MANWSTLKAAIAQIIKTNNNQEITGANMQSVLNNIIDNVGENATYAGIATPSTNPGVPDGNVFYIASEAGTYSNFNKLVLDAGNIGIFVYKSSWKLDKIPVLNSNEIAQIVSVDYSKNKWTGGEKYYLDASGNRVDSDSYLTTERISLKARQKLQCGYFTSVNEDGTGKNWIDFKPNQFVNYWGKDGNFERKVSSSISFPFTAEEDCKVSYTWLYTGELSDFKMNKYYGMLIISDTAPTKYVNGGKAISPAIIIPQLDDYIKDDNISKTVEAGNNNPVSSGAVYDALQGFLSADDIGAEMISEKTVYLTVTAKALDSSGKLAASNATAMETFVPFNPATPLKLTCPSKKAVYRVAVYSEPSENADEVYVYTNPSDNKIDASIHSNCKYFRFCINGQVDLTTAEAWTATGNFGYELPTEKTVEAGNNNPVSSGAVYDALQGFLSADDIGAEMISEKTVYLTVTAKALDSSGKLAASNATAMETFVPFNPATPLKLTCPSKKAVYRVAVYSEPSENADEVYVYTNPSDNKIDASIHSNCKYFRFCINGQVDLTTAEAWTATGNFGYELPTEKTVEADNNNPVSSGAVYDTLKTFSENLIQSEGKIPNLYAGARFFNERQKVETNISGNVYYLSDTGNDSNSGLSKDDAFLTANKALSVLADGDTLLIERGCHFRDVTQRITDKNYIKISAYGVGDNPVFEYLSILTNWEKVSEYNHIYRCNVHVTKCVAKRGMTQVFVDGKYMNVVYDTNDMEEAEAMEYLDKHPDSSSWCSCGKYSEGWEEQDCYYYVSLSDAPENHEIEANLNFTSGFIGIGNKHFDIRHLCQRGSGYRDGYSAAYNTYFEDCQFLDIAHHGIVFSKACFLNCTIKSEDPRGYQYHFLTDDKLSEDEDLIYVNCKAIMGGVYGSAFSGHRGGEGGIEIKYSNLYIEDCYVEGGSSVIGDTEYVNHLQVHNLILKNAGCIKGPSNNPGKVTINSIFGSIKQKPSGNNSILVSGNGAENIEIINARIEIYCPYNDAQQAICLFRNNGNINGNFTNVIIKNSIFKWNFSDNMEPNGYNAIFHSALNDMDTGDFNLENVMFVVNKTIPLGKPDTVHLTNSIFSNVILAGVDKSDVEKNCEEITLDEYNIMSLEKLFVNGGVICAI